MNEILIHGRHLAGPILLALDLLGTFVFALSGAAAGVKSKLDLFGLMVLAFAAGNAGGITRDLLIGAVPPAAISNWHYLAVSLLAGLATFFWYRISTSGADRCCCATPPVWHCSRSRARKKHWPRDSIPQWQHLWEC